jgi:hypothetical protein
MKELKDMNLEELIDYWTGYACMEIGRGRFRDAISLMLQSTMQNSYTRGYSETKKEVKKK